jgi:hypothetical protein
MRAEVEGRARANPQRQGLRDLESARAIADSKDARRPTVRFVRPAAFLAGRRGRDEVVGPTGKIGVGLDADLGIGDGLTIAVDQAPSDQRFAVERKETKRIRHLSLTLSEPTEPPDQLAMEIYERAIRYRLSS